MNRIQNTIVAALFFSFVGGNASSSQALQTGSNATATNSSAVAGTSNPNVGPHAVGNLPPIVSKEQAGGPSSSTINSNNADVGESTRMPPIISARSMTSVPEAAQQFEGQPLDSESIRRENGQNENFSGNRTLNTLRPIESVSSTENQFQNRATAVSTQDNYPGSEVFPRTQLPNYSQMPTHSNAGVPFYGSSFSGMSNPGWQDEPVQQPQSVLSNGGIVSPSNADGYGGTSPGSFGSGSSNGIVSGPTYFDSTPMIQNGMGYQSGLPGDCPTCGPSGCFNDHDIENRQGYFGAMSRARRYLELDLLYLTRSGDTIGFSNFGGAEPYDWGVGWRVTMGTRFDETSGREISYFGTEDIRSSIARTSPAGNLSAVFFPSPVYVGGETDAFFNAQFQEEVSTINVQSIELNRVDWAWDVIKSFVGIRAFYIDDRYQLNSQSGVDVGTYNLQATNFLIGPHIGREWFYDVGYRLSFSTMLKGGIYANATQFRATATNNGVNFLDNSTNRGAYSGNLELLLTGHYQINNRARLRGGFQCLAIDRVLTVEDNQSPVLSPFLGSDATNRDTMFFYGFNLGLELYR